MSCFFLESNYHKKERQKRKKDEVLTFHTEFAVQRKFHFDFPLIDLDIQRYISNNDLKLIIHPPPSIYIYIYLSLCVTTHLLNCSLSLSLSLYIYIYIYIFSLRKNNETNHKGL